MVIDICFEKVKLRMNFGFDVSIFAEPKIL